ncbi:amidohydrolase [Tabrizicola sp.]|uniref:amidohydrolase family protein n=1 Tax=Tabrizicola sp. TaxID=2005166 RepID=UPI0027339BB8|nr:amidohydrolase family protein [Tabrizicola sp.]MDP3196698.1 amidohydrolase family protein [Tabrizicola sp.]
MPSFPIVDSHLHLWDPRRLDYPWHFPPLDRAFLPADFRAASAGIAIEALVFLECDAAPDQAFDEAQLVLDWAKEEPRIAAMVCNAPLQNGDAARADLERLAATEKVRGVRRIYQDEPDPAFCLRPDFVTGVRALADYGLSFDLCLKHPQLQATIALADACPNVPMVLDHIAKPGIKAGLIQPWADQMRDLARRKNVVCKLSGVATEAGADWTPETLRPYMDVALEAFGPARIMFGGDWPVSTLAITYPAWVALVDDLIRDLSQTEQRQIFRDTARTFYRL